ncbi:MAG: YitT family protein [Erysipelotrichaceae bacterium]|nr:YitT family protein [Erysipelotrichaceae bacterium]MDY5251305.1 YitT family protein [Erysipelotrichaceae bacterium]
MFKNKNDFRRLVMVIISAFIYTIAMNTFVTSGNLFPGGFAGMSRIIALIFSEYFNVNVEFGYIFFTLNAIVTLLVYKKLGKKFLTLTVIWYSLTSLLTAYGPKLTITEDILLITVFGGILNGIAVGLALKNDASSGGTDFIAIVASMKYNKPTWNYVMVFNGLILCVAGLLFGWNQALYSIIFQFVSTQVINTLHQRYKLSNLFIITEKPEEVSHAIFKEFRHGITKIDGIGEYSHKQKSLLFMTVNTYQLKGITDIIKEVDDHVFISISASNGIVGNYYQKPIE